MTGKADGTKGQRKTLFEAALDPETRGYWQGRTVTGRRRIERFSRNFYRSGALGHCIGAGHILARLLGSNPSRIGEAGSLAEQRHLYKTELSPHIAYRVVRWLMAAP